MVEFARLECESRNSFVQLFGSKDRFHKLPGVIQVKNSKMLISNE